MNMEDPGSRPGFATFNDDGDSNFDVKINKVEPDFFDTVKSMTIAQTSFVRNICLPRVSN